MPNSKLSKKGTGYSKNEFSEDVDNSQTTERCSSRERMMQHWSGGHRNQSNFNYSTSCNSFSSSSVPSADCSIHQELIKLTTAQSMHKCKA